MPGGYWVSEEALDIRDGGFRVVVLGFVGTKVLRARWVRTDRDTWCSYFDLSRRRRKDPCFWGKTLLRTLSEVMRADR